MENQSFQETKTLELYDPTNDIEWLELFHDKITIEDTVMIKRLNSIVHSAFELPKEISKHHDRVESLINHSVITCNSDCKLYFVIPDTLKVLLLRLEQLKKTYNTNSVISLEKKYYYNLQYLEEFKNQTTLIFLNYLNSLTPKNIKLPILKSQKDYLTSIAIKYITESESKIEMLIALIKNLYYLKSDQINYLTKILKKKQNEYQLNK